MSDDGSTKDDVKVPDGEVGDKINKLFTEDGKDTSELSWNTISEALLTTVDVIVLTAMGEEACIDAKEAPKS
jgi:translation initiation factor 5A